MSASLIDAEPPAPAVAAWEPAVAAPAARTVETAPHDRLAVGMAFLLALTVAQRGVGLVRNVLFCRLLAPDELGRWNLAFAFLMLAAPLAVLGLPGSFGRYAEHYRKRGHLRTFVRRTAWASAGLTLAAAAALLAAPGTFAEIVFRDARQVRLLLAAAGALVTVVAFNFFTELFTALRQARVASTMQFAHSLIFTCVGLGLLTMAAGGAAAVVLAYAVGSGAACVFAAFALRPSWNAAPAASAVLSHRDFWTKLLPFAAWIWATNLLANLSDVADRYMILYLADADAAAAAALVGQYHSSRVAPDLLASMASMLAGVLLPYNSHDWEAGHRGAVAIRIRLALKATGWLFTAAGAALLWLAGPLFAWILDGKYALGHAILPWTLVLCIFFGLLVLSLNYLWCAERAGQAVLVMGAGLIANVALNALLLPRWGLTGAVVATAIANATALACAYGFNYRLGLRLDAGVLVASLAPISLLLGVAPACATVAVLALLAAREGWLLHAEERQAIAGSLRGFWPFSAIR